MEEGKWGSNKYRGLLVEGQAQLRCHSWGSEHLLQGECWSHTTPNLG